VKNNAVLILLVTHYKDLRIQVEATT